MDFGNFDIFAAKDEVAQQDRVLLLEPQLVYPDPHNVRRAIRPEEIDALAETIRARGQLQPIIVAPADEDGRYMIQFGERRWRACLQLGQPVRTIIREVLDASQIRIDQFIENDQREQLSVQDMIAFVADQVASGMSIVDLARATGRDRARLSRLHSLASAPDYIAARLDDIPVRGAVALMKAAANDPETVMAFLDATPPGLVTVAGCEGLSRPGPLPSVDLEAGNVAPVQQLSQDPRPVRTAPEGRTKPKRFGPEAECPDGARAIVVGGKSGRLVEALIHFAGEDQPRLVRFDR
jgi:ParB family transcriptional regulator, chromosome partitioning protein